MTSHECAADRRQFLAALAAAAAIPSIGYAKAPGGAHVAVRAMVDRYVADKKVANMVVAIGGRQGPPDFVSAGTFEFGGGPLAGPDTIYRIYSMSKPITGCAIMMLVEQGKLTLDTPLADIFPVYAKMNVLTDPQNSVETRPATKQIRIRHLLTHSSGLVYDNNAPPLLAKIYVEKGAMPGRGLPGDERNRPATLIGFAEATAGVPLMFEPGMGYKYSIGLDVAGAVVEKVSGTPFDTFLSEKLFKPLGMADTGFTVPAASVARFPSCYKFTDAGPVLQETGRESLYLTPTKRPGGGGGLVSTARDYSQFMAMLLGEGQLGKTRVMKTETARLMMSNLMDPGLVAMTSTYGPSPFGAGGRVSGVATPGGEGVGAFGWNGAAATQATVDRAGGVYVVLMTQVMGWLTNTLHKDVSAAAYADIARG